MNPKTIFLPLLAPFIALPLTGCMMNLSHTREDVQEQTDEERIEFHSTNATYLYDDDSLIRAQDQAVKALEIDDDHMPMRRMVGWIRLRMGTHDDLLTAEQFFSSLRSDGDDSDATQLGFAMTLERLGTAYGDAAARVADGTQIPPQGETAEDQAADLHEKSLEHWHRSIKLYEDSLNNGEGSTTAMNGLQRVNALLKEYAVSLAWSERLLERASEELETWRRLLSQADITQTEEALFRDNERVADELLLETHLFASSLLNKLGRDAEALEHMNTVVESRPRLPQAYSRRAQLRASHGEYALAVEDLDRFLGLSEQPYGDPEVRRAFEIRAECVREIEAGN